MELDFNFWAALLFLVKVVGGIALWLAAQFAIQEFARAWVNRRRELSLAQTILQKALEGVDENAIFRQMGFAYMGDFYHRYMRGLPDHKKSEILDKILANAEKRANSTELLKILEQLNAAETQTLISILYEKQMLNVRAGDMIDRLFVFRTTHPPEHYLGR